MSDEDYKNLLDGVEIGTPATRSTILTNAVKYGYITETKKGKSISYSCTKKGVYLINTLNTLGINLNVDKSVEFSKLLKDVYKNKKTISEVVKLVENELKNITTSNIYIEPFESEEMKKDTENSLGVCPNGYPVKKITKGTNVFYSNCNTEKPFIIFQKTKLMGNDVTLTDKQVVALLEKRAIKLKLISTRTNKPYEAEFKLKQEVGEKGYANFEMLPFNK